MRNNTKTQEKRCENCSKSDEQAVLAAKQLSRQKADNDVLVSQLKQLGDESKRVVENLVVPRLQPSQMKAEQQEDISQKQVEAVKKQLEQRDKRIKLLKKKEETPTNHQNQEEELTKLSEELEKAIAKNQELKKEQREADKTIKSVKVAVQVNSTKTDIKSLSEKLRLEQISLQKKQENREKIQTKMDEIEARHKEVCTKAGVTPMVRPSFKDEGGELAQQISPKKDMQRSVSDGSILKKEQNMAAKPEKITMETILQAKENLELINKNIKSYKKSHELRMINLVQKEDTDSTKNQDLLSELDMLTQECNKAQQVIKELQNVPRDSVLLDGSTAQFLTELPQRQLQTESSARPISPPVDTKTLMFNKNKFKRELNGSKFITDHSVLWADYNTLPGERCYKILGLKLYHNKESEVLRIEVEYLLSTGETEITAQPPNSQEIPNEKDIKCIDIKLARNEYLQEISGTNDATRITSLKIRTSMYKEYSLGQLRFGLKNKDFKFNILPKEKPVSLFGCFDVTKSGRLVLAQLGVEISKKDLVFSDQQRKDPWASKSVLVKSLDQKTPAKESDPLGV